MTTILRTEKQTERLLGRESDRRINTTGVLYVDSFGNRNAILSTPMIYDGLFMDMVEDMQVNAAEIASSCESGKQASYHLLLFQNKLQEEKDLPDNCYFLGRKRIRRKKYSGQYGRPHLKEEISCTLLTNSSGRIRCHNYAPLDKFSTTKLDIGGYIRVSESGLLAMIGCSAVINLKKKNRRT